MRFYPSRMDINNTYLWLFFTVVPINEYHVPSILKYVFLNASKSLKGSSNENPINRSTFLIQLQDI